MSWLEDLVDGAEQITKHDVESHVLLKLAAERSNDELGVVLRTVEPPIHCAAHEEAFIVDWHADGSISFTLRSVSRRSTGIWRSVYPGVALAQRCYRRRYLRALSGPF